MPIYFTEHGVELAMLGVVVAAWPAARLIGEPIFGWVADRTRRVPLMVAGNVLSGIFLFLPVVFVGIAPFTVLRALAGLSNRDVRPRRARATSPTRRPEDRRGEAFGLYGAAQMGGLLLGTRDRWRRRIDLRRRGRSSSPSVRSARSWRRRRLRSASASGRTRRPSGCGRWS
jgi:MFS family permease